MLRDCAVIELAEFVEHEEVEPGGDAALASGTDLEPVDDGGAEAPARAAVDAAPGDRHGEMALARAGAADQNPVAPGAKRVKT